MSDDLRSAPVAYAADLDAPCSYCGSDSHSRGSEPDPSCVRSHRERELRSALADCPACMAHLVVRAAHLADSFRGFPRPSTGLSAYFDSFHNDGHRRAA